MRFKTWRKRLTGNDNLGLFRPLCRFPPGRFAVWLVRSGMLEVSPIVYYIQTSTKARNCKFFVHVEENKRLFDCLVDIGLLK